MDSKDTSPYQLTLTNREVLQAGGILEVESFNENQIITATRLGALVIKGEGLHIVQLNLEEGKMLIEGKVNMLQYAENKKTQMKQKSRGILEKLLK
ncbi:MAG: sporulation protein YabP [Clostridia bacterium]|jgi:sporulation protein YabP|nr:sporulation protein YabP [Clostridia bacterium]